MARNIFIVDAHIIDANGQFHYIDGYPKPFDSKNYQDDVDKALKRADGDASEVWGAMCKVDTRKLQVVDVKSVDGMQITGYPKTMGSLYEPEQEEE